MAKKILIFALAFACLFGMTAMAANTLVVDVVQTDTTATVTVSNAEQNEEITLLVMDNVSGDPAVTNINYVDQATATVADEAHDGKYKAVFTFGFDPAWITQEGRTTTLKQLIKVNGNAASNRTEVNASDAKLKAIADPSLTSDPVVTDLWSALAANVKGGTTFAYGSDVAKSDITVTGTKTVRTETTYKGYDYNADNADTFLVETVDGAPAPGTAVPEANFTLSDNANGLTKQETVTVSAFGLTTTFSVTPQSPAPAVDEDVTVKDGVDLDEIFAVGNDGNVTLPAVDAVYEYNTGASTNRIALGWNVKNVWKYTNDTVTPAESQAMTPVLVAFDNAGGASLRYGDAVVDGDTEIGLRFKSVLGKEVADMVTADANGKVEYGAFFATDDTLPAGQALNKAYIEGFATAEEREAHVKSVDVSVAFSEDAEIVTFATSFIYEGGEFASVPAEYYGTKIHYVAYLKFTPSNGGAPMVFYTDEVARSISEVAQSVKADTGVYDGLSESQKAIVDRYCGTTN